MGAVALSAKQQRYVDEYLIDLNATQAAIRAGYSQKTAEQQGSRLLRNVQVKAAVDAGLAEQAKRTQSDGDQVLRELARGAFFDPAEMFDEHDALLPIHKMSARARASLAGFEVLEQKVSDGEGGEIVTGVLKKVKLVSKLGGLELLGKHHKLFTDKVEHEAGKSLETLLREMTALEAAKK